MKENTIGGLDRKSSVLGVARYSLITLTNFIEDRNVLYRFQQLDESKKFFKNLMQEDSAQDVEDVVDPVQCVNDKDELERKTEKVREVSEDGDAKVGETRKAPLIDNGNQENGIVDKDFGETRKSLEMKIVQEN